MTSNTSAIRRKRTSILLEPRIIVLLFAAVRQLNQSLLGVTTRFEEKAPATAAADHIAEQAPAVG